MFWRAYTTSPVYTAELTFMLNEDEGGGGMGGVSAILGQFGLGGGGGGKFNLEKMLQLAKSRRIIQDALFEKVKIAGKTDYLANHVIEIYDYHENWVEDSTGLANFLFVRDSIVAFDRIENTVLKKIHQRIIGGEGTSGLLGSSISEDTGILAMSSTTIREELSIVLTKTVYDKLSDFYISKSIERQKVTFNIIKNKADSLQNTLNAAQSRLLRFQDANRGLTLLRYEAEKIRLQQEIQKLIVAYGESYKQLEIADFSLRNGTPVVQVIDLPVAPIRPKQESKIKAIIIGCLLGVFLGVLLIIGRKFIYDAVNN